MQEKIHRNFPWNKKFGITAVYASFFFFILNSSSFPQIPINGFCKFSSQKILPDYNSLCPVNYNNDSYTDLLIFHNGKKKITQIEGNSSGNFEKQTSYDVPYEISKVARIYGKKNETVGYAFASRKGMCAGIFKFLKNGKPVLSGKIKFKSYPENICAADINKDKKMEIMVSGGSFEGLALLYEEKGILKDTYIDEKNCYTGAVFIDLTNDGMPDIAAYNLLAGTMIFFYNDGSGSFRKARTFIFSEKIHSFKVFDLNLDSYQDLMFISGRSVYIMYGDFRSSYEKRTILRTKYSPDGFVIGDYNRDGRIDLIYLNRSESVISALFASDRVNFYPEIILLHKPGISNLITYYSKFISGIAAISENGFIYTVSRLSSFADDASISIAAEPSAINYFDFENDGIYDICFIDEFDNSLKLMTRNSSGIPSLFYSYPMFGTHSRILVDDLSGSRKNFFCYTPGTRLVEKFSVDFLSHKIKREEIYSPGSLFDFKVVRRDPANYNIYFLYEKNNALGFSVYTKTDEFSFTENFESIAYNVAAAAVSNMNNTAFFYWKISRDSLLGIKKVLPGKRRIIGSKEAADNSQLITSKKINILQPITAEKEIITPFIGDIYNTKKEVCLTFISDISGMADSSKESAAVISTSRILRIIRTKDIAVTDEKQIFLGEMGSNDSKYLFIYRPVEKRLDKLKFMRIDNKLIVSTVADSVDINQYFIKNMSLRNYHLVYTDKKSGCISIRKIG